MEEKGNIYSYVNYRSFLKDFLQKKKESGKGLTQRVILELMGISSSGFLANVLSGKADLTTEQAIRLAEILGLAKAEKRYFSELVLFEKAGTLTEKTRCFEILNALRFRKLKRLNASELSLFSVWYYPVIRELLNFFEFKGDFKALGGMLIPKITAAQAEEAVRFLVENGFLEKKENGEYAQVHQALSTGNEVDSTAVNRFQHKLLELARDAFDVMPATERDVSGVTVTLSDSGYQRVKSAIADFRKQLLQIAVEEPSPNQVFRCNFQLFPVTRKNTRQGGVNEQS